MKPLSRHHHFRADLIPTNDRIARLEARVVAELRETNVPDARRDSSIAWELKHQAGVCQFARVLAAKRHLDLDLATAGALLHDIYTIVTGSYVDHARQGAPIAKAWLADIGDFTDADQDIVVRIVANHSDKHIESDDSYIEFGKDVDVLDCFLYPNSIDEYLLTKPLARVRSYLSRAKAVWAELGIPVPPAFHQLDEYVPNEWLTTNIQDETPSHQLLNAAAHREKMPPFAYRETAAATRCVTTRSGAQILANLVETVPERTPPESLPSAPPQTTVLVWPGSGRYETINEAQAESKGIRFAL